MQFKVRRILANNIGNELEKIGFSPSYLDLGAKKHRFLNIKIYDLKPEAATILKQTALSSGCDAAVNKGVLDHSTQKSDVILSGTLAQIKAVAEKLKLQQFSMPKIADEILKQAEIFIHNVPKKPVIMGILNVTEDSFSDGGRFLDPKKAFLHAKKMIEDGAKIIDIGAESTRPGAKAVPSDVEIERLTPVVKELKAFLGNNSGIKISIDTRNSGTARVVAGLGADIINDASGLSYDKNMAKTVREEGLQVVITHTRGTPENMDSFSEYKNTVDEVYFELLEKAEFALSEGVLADRIIIDPGFGFAKNAGQNFVILSKIEEFKSLGYPVLAGLSRKRFIKSLMPQEISADNETKTLDMLDNLTATASFYLANKGVDIIRVHNVAKTKATLDLAEALNV